MKEKMPEVIKEFGMVNEKEGFFFVVKQEENEYKVYVTKKYICQDITLPRKKYKSAEEKKDAQRRYLSYDIGCREINDTCLEFYDTNHVEKKKMVLPVYIKNNDITFRLTSETCEVLVLTEESIKRANEKLNLVDRKIKNEKILKSILEELDKSVDGYSTIYLDKEYIPKGINKGLYINYLMYDHIKNVVLVLDVSKIKENIKDGTLYICVPSQFKKYVSVIIGKNGKKLKTIISELNERYGFDIKYIRVL